MKKQKVTPGDIIKIQYDSEFHIYGRVLKYCDIAFYDIKTKDEITDLEAIIQSPIMFRAMVNAEGVEYRRWPVIGFLPLEEPLQNSKYWLPETAHPTLCKIFDNGVIHYKRPRSEGEGLYDFGMWSPDQIHERIKDFYNGVPNKWVRDIKTDIY